MNSCRFVKFVDEKRNSWTKKEIRWQKNLVGTKIREIRGQLKKRFVDPKSKYIMKLDTNLYARLLREAADNPRLRQATDLRTSPADQSQRMLNALLPGTVVPIHRHPHSAETAVVLSGCLDETYFDENGQETARFTLRAGEGLQIPLGQFHTVEVKEPTILFESKDGAYAPAAPEDIIEKQP